MVKIKTTEEQGPVLEPDKYPGKIKGFDQMEGQFGPQLIWIFDVEAPEEAVLDGFAEPSESGHYEVAGFTSFATGEKSKMRPWIIALLGDMPEEFDTDDLVGVSCTLDLETYEKKNGITKNIVDKVRAPRGNRGKQAKKKDAKKDEKEEASDSKEDDQQVDESDFEKIPF